MQAEKGRLPKTPVDCTMHTMPSLNPEKQRRFALEVVSRLRAAGFEAYWAGGCVRDQLLGLTPKDYDVATNAPPEKIRELFGHRRTLAIGAAFGVIAVLGPRGAGTVETTTFRRDAAYSDGRHPDSVTFGTAYEDAQRRDFTVNGLFFDPLEGRVIDFVGGQEDLAARRLRAIGKAHDRFAEDKLRMLRAIRLAAVHGFTLDEEITQAITEMAAEIRVVSAERIAVEMERLLTDAQRAEGVRLLLESGLAAVLLPEIVPQTETQRALFAEMLSALQRLGKECSFPPALAVMLQYWVEASQAGAVCRRWRLSNRQRQRVCWLVSRRAALNNAPSLPPSVLYPLLAAEGGNDLVRFCEAIQTADAQAIAYCRHLLVQPREVLDPPAVVTGDDLAAQGISPGPLYKTLLYRLRAAQLDGLIHSKTEALKLVEKWLAEEEKSKHTPK